MRKWITILVGLFISVLALFLAFRQADFAEMGRALREARYQFVFYYLITTLLLLVLRGWRWSILTNGRLSLQDGFWLFNIGTLLNNILPARLGEIGRAVLAGSRSSLHFTSALSSIVVERLFDIVAVVTMFVVVLIGLDLPGWAQGSGIILGGGAATGIVLLALAARSPNKAISLGGRILAWTPFFTREDAERFLSPFVDGLSGVKDLRTFVGGLLLSLLAWIGSGISTWVLMYAFWEDGSFIMGLLAVVAAGMGLTVPSAPSGVGPFHAAVIGMLSAVGFDADITRSYAFVMHGGVFLLTTVLGLLGLLREGVSLGDVVRRSRETQQKDTGNSTSQEDTPAPQSSL